MPTTPTHVVAAAREWLRQHETATPMTPLPEGLAAPDLATAVAIQEALITLQIEERGRRLAGWKVALTTPVMQTMVGVDHPCAGAIFADTVQTSPARLEAARFVRIGVESEIAVRIGTDAESGSRPHSRQSIRAHVSHCIPALEIVDDRNWDYSRADARELISDNSFNFGCVLGTEVEGWQELDLPALAGRMRLNGEVVGTGRGADVLGHPLEALAWLANHLNERGRHLRVGDIVLTGSLVATRWPTAGDTVVTEIDSLGDSELSLI